MNAGTHQTLAARETDVQTWDALADALDDVEWMPSLDRLLAHMESTLATMNDWDWGLAVLALARLDVDHRRRATLRLVK